jgi:hypothetical protein
VIRALVDPAQTPDRSAPRNERDLLIAANNGHMVAFDNLSALKDWQRDGLARLSTGAGFGTPELHSDAEETLFWAARAIILNGITDLAVRSDLLDRSLLVTLPRIPDERRQTVSPSGHGSRLPDRRFWRPFSMPCRYRSPATARCNYARCRAWPTSRCG